MYTVVGWGGGENPHTDCICRAKPKNPIFEKFLEIFFRKFFFQNFKKFSAHKKFMNCFLNFFEKQFPKKTIFFSKKKKNALKKNKVLVYWGKKFFSEKTIFL